MDEVVAIIRDEADLRDTDAILADEDGDEEAALVYGSLAASLHRIADDLSKINR